MDAWGLPSSVQHARPFWHVSAMLGVARGCLALMWPVAMHAKNKNELLAWDLAHDPTELARLNATDLRLRLFTKVADMPEGLSRLPLKSIHLNRSPTPSYRCPGRGYFGCAGGLRQCHSAIRWLKPLPSAAPVLYGASSRFSAVTCDPGVVAARMQD